MTPGWSCAACSQDNPVGAAFCGHCGARDEVERPLPDTLWACRSCGSPNDVVMAFCGRCGSRRGVERADDLRLVTALFADISGFTTLADQLDAEDLHAVINPLIAGLAGIAERYGGFVAKYAGDALLCLFGAPVAHEDDAQRALLAAYEMQAQLPALLASLGPEATGLTIHVGVNTGKVVAGAVGSAAQSDYSVLGDSVILAQRLESVCPSGQTYVGESTRDLCKDEFDFEDVGELQLKGKLTVVRAFRLVGRKRSGTDTAHPLVGRDDELATVLDAVARSSVAVVSGEPGVGKSRLLAEARVRATASGSWWLPMRCLSYGASLPYWPFVDLLRQSLNLRLEQSVEDVLDRLTSTLPEHLVAGASRLLGRPVDELGPEAARRQVHDSLAGMLAFLSGGRPITLAVEDAHWIDSASAEALGELIRSAGVPLSVVLSTRPEGLEACRALAADVPDALDVDLRPLGPEAVPALAAATLGRPVSGGLVELLVARTRGNPLFVEELSRSLLEEGALVPTSSGLDLRPGFDTEAVPQTVERVFNARVDALPLPSLAVLSIAAVVGRVARLSLLTAVARANGTTLEPLEDLVEAGLLDRVTEQDEPAATFHHALLQDVVYGRLLKKQRRALHRTVADAGLALYGDGDETVDLLARHLYLADAGEEALAALLRAGRRAAALYANDAAAEHLARALEVLGGLAPEDDRVADVLKDLGAVQETRGAYDEALAVYERLASVAPTYQEGWRGVAAVLRKTGRYDDAIEAVTRGPQPLPPLVQVELARSQALGGDLRAAQETAHSAHRASSTAVEETESLLTLTAVHMQLGEHDAALTFGTAALKQALAAQDRRRELQARRMLGDAYFRGEAFPEAVTHLRLAVALAEQLGDVEEVAGGLLNLGMVESRRGNGAAAEEATLEAARLFERIGHGSGTATCYCNLADFVLARGATDEARLWAQRSLDTSARIGNRRMSGYATITLAEIELACADAAAAREHALNAREIFVQLGLEAMQAYCDEVMARVVA